jgi:hypothetical protein
MCHRYKERPRRGEAVDCRSATIAARSDEISSLTVLARSGNPRALGFVGQARRSARSVGPERNRAAPATRTTAFAVSLARRAIAKGDIPIAEHQALWTSPASPDTSALESKA